jgi:hypothetical protein
MNNINFQGRSNLILNPDAYDKARVATSNAYRHLSSKNNCKLTNGKVFTSKADAQNLAVIVRNEKDGIIKHVPVNGRIQKVIDEIAQKVDELKAMSKGKLTAWIIGGENIESGNGGKTIEAVNKIADVICDRPDIDASILAGSKTGEDKIILHTLNDKLEITLDKFVKLNPETKKPAITDLEEFFDIVELNNTDILN